MLALPAPPQRLALPAPLAWDWSWAFYPPPPPQPACVPILMYRYDENDGLANWTSQALAVLAANNRPPSLFQRGDTLVRLQDSPLTRRSRLVALDDVMLKYHISEHSTWSRVMINSRGQETIDSGDTPIAVAKNILAMPAWHPAVFPPVRELAECPRFSREGRLLAAPGYYRREELVLRPPPDLEELPAVPAQPTPAEVEAARETLEGDLLSDFGLDEPSLAHALCALWEPLVRRMVAGPCPLYLYDAPTIGSGKTLLASVTQVAATGRPGEPTPPKEDDAEMRKTLTSLLLNSPTYVLLDNAHQLRSFPSLAALITSPSLTWHDRILGESRMVELPICCTFAVTSNNLLMNRELHRRTVLVRLQPGVEEPWKRSGFRHEDLIEWAVANRAELLWSALLLIQNWIAAGQPPGRARMGSFEGWARVMGGILAQAGIDGFLQNRDSLFDRDADALRWRALAREWHRQHGVRLVSIADIYALITLNAELDVAFADVLGQGQERKQRQQLAKALAAQAGRIWAGFCVEPQHHAGAGGFPLYRLLPTKEVEAQAEAEAEAEAEVIPPGRGDAWEPDDWEPDAESPNPWDDPDPESLNPWDDPDRPVS
jgi:hypothetical protein